MNITKKKRMIKPLIRFKIDSLTKSSESVARFVAMARTKLFNNGLLKLFF